VVLWAWRLLRGKVVSSGGSSLLGGVGSGRCWCSLYGLVVVFGVVGGVLCMGLVAVCGVVFVCCMWCSLYGFGGCVRLYIVSGAKFCCTLCSF